MAESPDSLFRRGMISSKQMGKLAAQRGTRAEPSKMANFDDKGGRRDQGAGRDRGISETSVGHINNARQQREGSAIASKPTRGGRVNKGGQPGVDAINQDQRPAFPAGGTPRKQSLGTPARARGGRQRPSGPMYGGPNGRP
jgi:hypothetical protein